jgi:hypothetical protein
MSTVAGIFKSYADAGRAADNLRSVGIAEDHINLLAPGASEEELDAAVPTTETEQPGMGKALGGWAGGALGVAGGMHIGAAAASLFVPGVGPVLAAGILGAALLGAGGAAAGAYAGSTMEDEVAGLPHDELYIYEDALRKGHSVVIAVTDDDAQSEAARAVLAQAGAESVDAAREDWWVGLRDAEEEKYTEAGYDFHQDESLYRRGFEAALHPKVRGHSYQESTDYLRECYGDVCTSEAFRRGYERGQAHHQSLRDKYKS